MELTRLLFVQKQLVDAQNIVTETLGLFLQAVENLNEVSIEFERRRENALMETNKN